MEGILFANPQQSNSDWQLFFYLLIRIVVSYPALWRHIDKIEQKYSAKLP